MANSRKLLFYSVLGIFAFSINTIYAISYRWSLQELCWSMWLAALFFSWTCTFLGAVSIVLNTDYYKNCIQSKIAQLKKVPDEAFFVLLWVAVLLVAWIISYIYCYLFSFYGIFLSVFAEMEPHSFFGRNGFVNSDFFSPVIYLLIRFWPMVLGVFISNLNVFVKGASWRLMFLPFKSGEIAKIHVMVVVMPFLCLFAWMISRDSYQPITISLLMAALYLVRVPDQKDKGLIKN